MDYPREDFPRGRMTLSSLPCLFFQSFEIETSRIHGCIRRYLQDMYDVYAIRNLVAIAHLMADKLIGLQWELEFHYPCRILASFQLEG